MIWDKEILPPDAAQGQNSPLPILGAGGEEIKSQKGRKRKMTIDQIPAGPKLDLLVANKVMGEYPKHEWSLPRYSTDISAAWAVVEKLDPRYGVTVWHDEQSWSCFFGIGVEARFRCGADTAPLAICRAALMTKIPDGELG